MSKTLSGKVALVTGWPDAGSITGTTLDVNGGYTA